MVRELMVMNSLSKVIMKRNAILLMLVLSLPLMASECDESGSTPVVPTPSYNYYECLNQAEYYGQDPGIYCQNTYLE